jgi:four helix bundle protein
MPAYDLCQRTFEFSLEILKLWQKAIKVRGFPQPLANQLLRAGTSIGANVEEGRAGQSKPDFISKCSIARKESRETSYWLRMMVASKLVSESDGRPLIKEAEEIISILTAIIKNTKGINTKYEERSTRYKKKAPDGQ